jgi:DNA mismatch endonuclease (patch repair protein)
MGDIVSDAQASGQTSFARLPGQPDIVLPKMKKAIFVHGCFWHGHSCARGARVPKTNRGYWVEKIARNMERDQKTRRELRKAGWSVMTVWECRLRNPALLKGRISRFLAKALS